MHKHYSNRWLLLLLPLALFSACKDYDGSPFDEEGYYSVFDDDRVSLAFTVENPATTRMSDAITQANDVTDGTAFRGMSDVVLVPFYVAATGSDCIGADNTPIDAQNVLGNNTTINSGATSSNTVTPNQIYNDTHGGANSKYYLQTPLPIGTNAFLVYGRAKGNNGTLAQKQENGILTRNGIDATGLTGALSGVSFSPVQMVTAPTSAGAAGENGDALITYLNSIFGKQTGETHTKWANTDYPALNGFYPMVQAMKAGASASVQAFVQKMYDLLKTATGEGVSDMLTAISNDTYVSVTSDVVTIKDAYKSFPSELGLPDGAAVIIWDNDNEVFKAVTDQNNLGAMNVNVTQFAFPAELYYRANSRIHTSTTKLTTAMTPQSIFNHASWSEGTDAVLTQSLFTANGTVQTVTTVVAITDPLQYAVGRLDAMVSVNGTTTDGKYTIPDATNTPVDVSKLKVTGVLVGGQKPVDFLFHPKTVADANAFTIYDNQINVSLPTAANTLSDPTRTLVLESEAGKAVNVALELLNNGDEFIVQETVLVDGEEKTELRAVPNGCKFYLIGQLTPGTTQKAFTQDYVTKVTFIISSLANAYYYIPTLTSQDLVFSLGVIDWKLSTPFGKALKETE